VGLVTSLGRAILGAGSQQRKTIEENTKALENLRRDFQKFQGLVGSFTGAEIARAKTLAAAKAGHPEGLTITQFTPSDLALLEATARALGITLDGTKASFEALWQALNAFDMTKFQESFAGALSALELKFRVFDIKDPVQKLEEMLKLFLKFTDIPGLLGDQVGPELAQQIGGPLDQVLRSLDLSRKEDREKLDQIIKTLTDLFLQGKLDLSALNMTIPEFQDWLATASDLLRQAQGTSGGVTESFVRQAQITEAQGSQFLALLSTSVALQQLALQTADLQLAELRAIHAAVGSPAIPAPGLPVTAPAPPPPTIEVGPVTVNISTVERVEPVQVTDQLVEAIDRALQDRARTSAWFRGLS
jgi:hypothetical protein